MQRDTYINSRAKFCQKAIKNPQNAASDLRDLATGLENCRNSSEIIFALSEIFRVHEITIERDLTREIT